MRTKQFSKRTRVLRTKLDIYGVVFVITLQSQNYRIVTFNSRHLIAQTHK